MNYHGRVMNIPAEDKYAGVLAMKAVRVSYQEGHRDARHAAAEIANEADARVSELEAENAALKEKVAAAEDVAEAYQLELADAAERTREIEDLKAQRDKLRAVLEGAGYNEIDDMLTRDIEVCRRTGETVAAMTQLHIDAGVHARNQLEAANARADAAEKALIEDREIRAEIAEDREREYQRWKKAEAEAGRLRGVVEQYANPDNWMVYNDPEGEAAPEYTWRMDKPKTEGKHVDSSYYDGMKLATAALQDGPVASAAKLRENCIAYPTKLPERPTCVWLSDGRKIGIQREGGAVWLRIENAATVIPATPDAADIDAHGDAGE